MRQDRPAQPTLCCPSIGVASDDANVVALVSRVGTLPDAKAFNGNGLEMLWESHFKEISIPHRNKYGKASKNVKLIVHHHTEYLDNLEVWVSLSFRVI